MKTIKYFISALIFICTYNSSSAQESRLTIEDCILKAENNYPLIKQYGLLKQSKEYTLSNLSKNYLPQVTFNAQASYQSDVISFPGSVPGVEVPVLDKDQFKFAIDATQTIWDGGVTHSQQKIAEAANEVDRQSVEINLYAICDRINQLYFAILTVDEQLRQLDILQADLQSSFDMVTAFVNNGTATQSDADAVRVEILNNEQKKIELNAFRKAYSEMLSAFINEKISEQTVFVKPTDSFIDPTASVFRPEMELFEKQRQLYNSQENLIEANNRPKLGLFFQGGYSKPGLDVLSNQFDFFALGGIKLSWNFGSLYTKSNEKHQISINKSLVNTEEETFVFNTNLQMTQEYNEILKARELMKKDDEIISLRNRVKTASQSKYENGVYTINDLIKDINAENQSNQLKILHEIQYLTAIYNYKNTQGTNE